MPTKRESPGETAHWLLCEYSLSVCVDVTEATFRDTFQMLMAGTVGDKCCRQLGKQLIIGSVIKVRVRVLMVMVRSPRN